MYNCKFIGSISVSLSDQEADGDYVCIGMEDAVYCVCVGAKFGCFPH